MPVFTKGSVASFNTVLATGGCSRPEDDVLLNERDKLLTDAVGANANPLSVALADVVYKVRLSVVVMLIGTLYPAASVSRITLLAAVAPVPVVAYK